MTTNDLGFDQFLRRNVEASSYPDSLQTLIDSDLGPKSSVSPDEFRETTPQISVSAIMGDIVANSVTANSVTTAMLQASAVTAAKIAASTITADKIAASTITADKLSVSTLSAISANLGTITAGTLDAVTVTGSTLQTGTVGENVNITATAVQLRDGTTVYGTLRGKQVTDRTGFTLNRSYLEAYNVGTPDILLTESRSGGGYVGAPYIFAQTTGGSTQGLALVSSYYYFLGAFDGSVATVVDFQNLVDVRVPLSAGAPTGGASGSMQLDTTNSRIYFRVGATWKYAALI